MHFASSLCPFLQSQSTVKSKRVVQTEFALGKSMLTSAACLVLHGPGVGLHEDLPHSLFKD